MLQSRLSLITFDLDNTLWDSDAVIERAHQAMCAHILSACPGAAPWIAEDSAWRDMRTRIARERADIRHHPSLMRKAVTRELLMPLGLGTDERERLVEESFAVFHAGRNTVTPYPEAVELLAWLQPRIPVVAITNGNAHLSRIGLEHFFTGIVSAESAGVAKPHPDIFTAALSITGCPAHLTLHVGDHPEEDIRAARTLGFKTLWIKRPAHTGTECESDAVAASPSCMARQIRCWLEANAEGPV
jgi:HAD superfamily hydrolase (TIGR01549 family)